MKKEIAFLVGSIVITNLSIIWGIGFKVPWEIVFAIGSGFFLTYISLAVLETRDLLRNMYYYGIYEKTIKKELFKKGIDM